MQTIFENMLIGSKCYHKGSTTIWMKLCDKPIQTEIGMANVVCVSPADRSGMFGIITAGCVVNAASIFVDGIE